MNVKKKSKARSTKKSSKPIAMLSWLLSNASLKRKKKKKKFLNTLKKKLTSKLK